MGQKIKFKGENFVQYKPPESYSKESFIVPFDTDLENWKVEIFSNPNYIRGILLTKTLNNEIVTHHGRKWKLEENGEIVREELTDSEIESDDIIGYFEYTRSNTTVEGFGCQLSFHLNKKQSKALERNIEKIVNKKLQEEAFERFKSQRK